MHHMKRIFIVWLACLAACSAAETKAQESDLELYLQLNKPQPSQLIEVPPLDSKDIPGFKPVLMSDLPDFQNDMEVHCTKSGRCNACGLLCTINFEQFES